VQAEQIVFDEDDYREWYSDSSFTGGLLELLSSRVCVFLGFSFRDPGIDFALRTWTERKGPSFPKVHLAVLPRSSESLSSHLTAMNVRVVTYDDQHGDHSELWTAISRAASALSAGSAQPGGGSYRLRRMPLAAVRDMLGLCYARASLGKRIEPLRNVVLDGAILAQVTQAGPEGIAATSLRDAISRTLGVLLAEIEGEIDTGIQRLAQLGACTIKNDIITGTGLAVNELDRYTKTLAQHVFRRIVIREGVRLQESLLGLVARTFEDLLMARAWDLAAHFVQPRSGALHGIEGTVTEVLRFVGYPPDTDLKAIARGITDLLVRPSGPEAELLAELGRLAFAVQLALGHARTTFSYAATLPQVIYLDASVLMPAIVEGHPAYTAYSGRCRSPFRADGDHDSGRMPIRIPG
jgi:hypothetical protein